MPLGAGDGGDDSRAALPPFSSEINRFTEFGGSKFVIFEIGIFLYQEAQ